MIIAATTEHIDTLLDLWAEYQTFYQVQDINREKNRCFIISILGNTEAGKIHLVHNENGTFIGFSTLYFTYASTVAERVAVLNDLYVQEAYRNRGYGKQMINHAIDYVGSQGISTVRWMTQRSNTSAQKLYDNYATPSEWMLYAVKQGK